MELEEIKEMNIKAMKMSILSGKVHIAGIIINLIFMFLITWKILSVL